MIEIIKITGKIMKKLSLALSVCLPLCVFPIYSFADVESAQIDIEAPGVMIEQSSENNVILAINAEQQERDAKIFLDIISKIHTIEANLEIISVSSSRSAVQESVGLFKVKKPGKYAWIIQTPNETYDISNGKKVWKYDVDLEEVNINKVDDKNSQMIRLLQTDQTQDLLSEYQISADRYGDESVFTFVPLNNEFGFSHISISFVLDKLNNIRLQTDLQQSTIFDFKDVITNEPIKDSEFELAIPEGVDVFDNTLFDNNY